MLNREFARGRSGQIVCCSSARWPRAGQKDGGPGSAAAATATAAALKKQKSRMMAPPRPADGARSFGQAMAKADKRQQKLLLMQKKMQMNDALQKRVRMEQRSVQKSSRLGTPDLIQTVSDEVDKMMDSVDATSPVRRGSRRRATRSVSPVRHRSPNRYQHHDEPSQYQRELPSPTYQRGLPSPLLDHSPKSRISLHDIQDSPKLNQITEDLVGKGKIQTRREQKRRAAVAKAKAAADIEIAAEANRLSSSLSLPDIRRCRLPILAPAAKIATITPTPTCSRASKHVYGMSKHARLI